MRKIILSHLSLSRQVKISNLFTRAEQILFKGIHLATSENLIMDIHKGVIRIRAKANKFFDLMSSPKVSSINSKCFVFEKQLTS